MMKRIICIAVLFMAALGLKAQSQIENYPLPVNPDTLKILAIGNSFSDDGTEYLPSLLENAGIHNVIVARLYIGGCSLERHCQEYDSQAKDYQYYKSGSDNRWTSVKGVTINHGLKDEDWDIITIQQASGYSGQYETIGPWGLKLISYIRKECSNPKATIVWHQTWAYATNSNHNHFPFYDRSQQKMYDAICDCVAKAKKDMGIDVVIPSGVAIQIARETRLNNNGKVSPKSQCYELTRDGFHLSRQHGRYIAACCWFEALVQPTLGKSVKGNPCRLLDTEYYIDNKDAKLCQKVAIQAVKEARK